MLREPPDVVVHGLVAGRRERLAVAAFQHQAARAGVVDVAALDAMARAARDANAQLASVADFAGLDPVAAAAGHLDAVAQGRFHDEPAQRHMRGVLAARPAARSTSTVRCGHRSSSGGRPEIEPAGSAVQVELARLIQLLQQVQRDTGAVRDCPA